MYRWLKSTATRSPLARRAASLLGCLLATWAFLSSPSNAQMVTGDRMPGYTETFGITAHGWSAEEVDCSSGGQRPLARRRGNVYLLRQAGPGLPRRPHGRRRPIWHQGQAGRLVAADCLQDRRWPADDAGRRSAAGGGMVEVKPQIGSRFRRICGHPGAERPWPGLRGDLRPRAATGAGPRTAAHLRHGPGLAARVIAQGLQRLQAARRERAPASRAATTPSPTPTSIGPSRTTSR